MANKGLSIPQTKGTFQFRGIVTGTGKDTFYKVSKTKTGLDFRRVSFGVQVSKDSILYVELSGMPQENVFFSGKSPKASKETKNDTVKVAWKDRNTFRKEGYRLIGVNCGLEKIMDEKGKEVNDKRILVPFDACEYVREHLQDGQSVFVKGTVEYGHYDNNGQQVNTVKYIPNQISLCQDVDFDKVDEKGNAYEVVNNFTQNLVFQSIEKEEGQFVLTASIVNYNTIETATFVVENDKLAVNFKKNVKPYTYIPVWGNVVTVRNVEEVEVETDDGWGNSNPMNRVNSPYRVVRIITGANPNEMDKETYSEKAIANALEEMKNSENKEKAFESPDGEWGNSKKNEETDVPW